MFQSKFPYDYAKIEGVDVSQSQSYPTELENGISAPIGKDCSNCKKWKSIDDFHKKNGGVLNRHSHCKKCILFCKKKKRAKLKKNRKSTFQLESIVIGTLSSQTIENFCFKFSNCIQDLIDSGQLT